ncbi:PREDICTED: probable ubiquitin-like-specific protease 2B [Nelumbo nucifera]|uniref:Ubiquitin-like protease family profile domain-containing protein n=2 Tax=Nelumbo nucifera TaxID=4432 RepID=A0A822XSP2_NELNU|nr:PREDICTED: probable ubiquitin-like-specific protease 2B [Nelumbo nucifera]DAD22109.1 TPA_asm: hypothetical protein HUJ06_023572 [Nelumbo nucifera]
MKSSSSSRKDLTVFDFKEEDEVIESLSGRFMGKFNNSDTVTPPVTKYQFLQCFAGGTNTEQTEISNASCVEVDASDSDRKCSNGISHVLDVAEVDCAIGRESSGLDGLLASNSMNYEPPNCNNTDNDEPKSLSVGLNSLPVRPLSLGLPSSGNKLFDSTHLKPLSNGEPVDVLSDDDNSMKSCSPPTSPDLVENEVSCEEPVSDHCSGGWEMDPINMDVVISPDYVTYGDAYCTESVLIFSCSCIKFESSTAYGNKEWAIDDIIDIESHWCGRVETAMVKLCLKSTGSLGDESGRETPDILELVFVLSDPNWSEKQEKITSLNERYKAIWNVVLDTDLVREEDFAEQNSMISSKHYFPNFDEPFEDVIYPKGDPDAVSISKRDVELLQPETFINDTIIDFYIKYLKNKIKPESKHRFHFFNSFFFRKLADMDKDPSSASEGRAAFQRVRKWTRKVNLFEKDYIFIPVNFNLHWSLMVICHPGEIVNFKDEDLIKATKVPCILHMDSIKGSHKGLKNLVQSYLWEEWKERQKALEDVSEKFLNLRFIPLELPQQENSFDCGLFLLHYVELFLEDAPVNFNPFRITRFSSFLSMDWFPPSEASLKRAHIQKLIHEILDDQSQKAPSTFCGDEHQSFKFIEKNDTENTMEFVTEKHSPAKTFHGNSSCSTAEQGIEIKLLASPSLGGVQCSKDSGLVFRELFEPGAISGSYPGGQYRPLDQMDAFQRFKSSMPSIEEDAETGKQFMYAPSGEACHPLAGMTNEACSTSYFSKDFETSETLWNPRICMELDEEEDGGSSPDSSGCVSQYSSEIGVDDEHCQIRDFVGLNQPEGTEVERPRSVSPENIGCVTGSPGSDSSGRLEACVVEDGRLEACVVEDSQEVVDRMDDSYESKGSLPCQENPLDPPHQEVASAEQLGFIGNDVETSADDSDSNEKQSAKRPRLMLPVEEER